MGRFKLYHLYHTKNLILSQFFEVGTRTLKPLRINIRRKTPEIEDVVDWKKSDEKTAQIPEISDKVQKSLESFF